MNIKPCQVGGAATRLPAEQFYACSNQAPGFPFQKTAWRLCGKMQTLYEKMSQKAIDAVFTGLFNLTDIRIILRETSPLHHLTDEQKARTKDTIKNIRKQLEILEGELL